LPVPGNSFSSKYKVLATFCRNFCRTQMMLAPQKHLYGLRIRRLYSSTTVETSQKRISRHFAGSAIQIKEPCTPSASGESASRAFSVLVIPSSFLPLLFPFVSVEIVSPNLTGFRKRWILSAKFGSLLKYRIRIDRKQSRKIFRTGARVLFPSFSLTTFVR